MKNAGRPVLAAALFAITVVPAIARAQPLVTKVEPPSWWPGHTIDPVRVLIRGRNLAGARVRDAPGVSVRATRANAAGTHLFVDLAVRRNAAPGPRTLRVQTPSGAADAPFEVLAPLPRTGRFQGVSSDDVMYLIMPDRFANGDVTNDDPPEARGLHDRTRSRYYHGGDLQGVIDRLPYLKDLGVTALWLNPWYDNVDQPNERQLVDGQPVTDYHGYGATDFYAVEEHLGDLARLRDLVDAAHRLGIKVVQDQVANHTGPSHPWTADPPTPSWFHGTPAAHPDNDWQIWTLMDPHADPALRRPAQDGWFANVLPDLDQDDPEVARYLIQNSLWWVGVTGLDAIRQDTLPYAPRPFWRDWTAALRREYPALNVVGEVLDADPALVAFFQAGVRRFDGIDTGVDTLFDFPLYFAARRVFVEGRPVRDLATVLAHDHLYARPDALLTFLGLHDVPRFMSEAGATAAGLKLGFMFVFTARGMPMVYYGDEIAMRGGGDPDNRRDFPGGWSEDPRDAFTQAGRSAEEQSVFEHVRRLGRLRAESVALRRGRMVHLAVGDQTLAYARVAGKESAVVVINNGTQPADVVAPVASLGLADGVRLEDALGSGPTAAVEGGRLRVSLPARSGVVYRKMP